MESQSLSPSSRLHIGDLVALGPATACLVGTVAFLQIKVVPTYVTVLVFGTPLPFPQQVATWVCNFTTRYVLAGFLIWALYALSSPPLGTGRPSLSRSRECWQS